MSMAPLLIFQLTFCLHLTRPRYPLKNVIWSLRNLGNKSVFFRLFESILYFRKNLRACVNKFYANWMKCCTESCANRTRNLLNIFRFFSFFLFFDSNVISSQKGETICPACNDNTLRQEYPASDLYLQLKYYERLFSFDKWKTRITNEMKEQGLFSSRQSVHTLLLQKKSDWFKFRLKIQIFNIYTFRRR